MVADRTMLSVRGREEMNQEKKQHGCHLISIPRVSLWLTGACPRAACVDDGLETALVVSESFKHEWLIPILPEREKGTVLLTEIPISECVGSAETLFLCVSWLDKV